MRRPAGSRGAPGLDWAASSASTKLSLLGSSCSGDRPLCTRCQAMRVSSGSAHGSSSSTPAGSAWRSRSRPAPMRSARACSGSGRGQNKPLGSLMAGSWRRKARRSSMHKELGQQGLAIGVCTARRASSVQGRGRPAQGCTWPARGRAEPAQGYTGPAQGRAEPAQVCNTTAEAVPGRRKAAPGRRKAASGRGKAAPSRCRPHQPGASPHRTAARLRRPVTSPHRVAAGPHRPSAPPPLAIAGPCSVAPASVGPDFTGLSDVGPCKRAR